MKDSPISSSKLPFKCRALCVSLAGASLLLIVDFLLYFLGYLSAEVAVWVATAVFLLAAIYESFLLSVVTKHMMNKLNQDVIEP